MRLPAANPVFARELKERMRTRRGAVLVTVYLLALTGILKLVAEAAAQSARAVRCYGGSCFSTTSAFGGSALGRPIFHWILFFVLVLVCFIVPGLTAGAIAGERARQTLAPLQVTLLRPRSILVGKLLASLAFVGLLLVATLPLVSAAFWVGGITAWDVVAGFGMVMATAVTLACVGLACSAMFRRVTGAIVATYWLVFLLTIGTVGAWAAGMAWNAAQGRPAERNPAFLVFNPFVATADVLAGPTSGFGRSFESPFDGIASVFGEARLLSTTGLGARVSPGSRFPYWILALVGYGVLSAGSLWLGARRLRTPSDRVG